MTLRLTITLRARPTRLPTPEPLGRRALVERALRELARRFGWDLLELKVEQPKRA